jgi:hypothetical protein
VSSMMIGFTIHAIDESEWLEVTIDEIGAVGLSPSSFSELAFRDGDVMYLPKEDDGYRFLIRYDEVYGDAIGILLSVESHDDDHTWTENLKPNGEFDA